MPAYRTSGGGLGCLFLYWRAQQLRGHLDHHIVTSFRRSLTELTRLLKTQPMDDETAQACDI
jgi:hypothetical protein